MNFYNNSKEEVLNHFSTNENGLSAQEAQTRLEKNGKNKLAEGEKESTILRAEAKKLAQIAEAEGQAQAEKALYEAQAYGIKIVNEADPGQAYLTLKAYEALKNLAEGQSTKIIVPSNIQELAGLVTSIKEISNDKKQKDQ